MASKTLEEFKNMSSLEKLQFMSSSDTLEDSGKTFQELSDEFTPYREALLQMAGAVGPYEMAKFLYECWARTE